MRRIKIFFISHFQNLETQEKAAILYYTSLFGGLASIVIGVLYSVLINTNHVLTFLSILSLFSLALIFLRLEKLQLAIFSYLPLFVLSSIIFIDKDPVFFALVSTISFIGSIVAENIRSKIVFSLTITGILTYKTIFLLRQYQAADITESTLTSTLLAIGILFILVLFWNFILSLFLTRLQRISQEKIEMDVLKEVSSNKSQFISTLSHELRTPLGAIIGFIDLLLHKEQDEEKKAYLHTTLQAGQDMLTLMNEVLDFAKIESREIELRKYPFDLCASIRENVHFFKPQFQKKGVELRFYCSLDCLFVDGDRNRMGQILKNIIGNAYKFTQKGHVKITVETKNLQGNYTLITCCVSDTGPGIEPEKIDLVFEPFKQVHDYQQGMVKGTGLGMSITKELVELMGGRIWIESTPGVGSSFFFEIPFLVVETSFYSTPHKAIDHSRFQQVHLNILAADDDPLSLDLLRNIFQSTGTQLTAVNRGQKALRELEKNSYDLVLMDIQMPDMDGVETTRKIRESGNPIPIIALTAEVLPEQKESGMRAGMDAYITKPFTSEELLDTILNITHYSENNE